MKAKRKNKLIIIGVILTIIIGGVLTHGLVYSKYRATRNVNLATGTIKNTSLDFQMAVKISDDGENYSDTSSVPASGYTLNTSKSVCNVDNVKDSNITIEYIDDKINFLGATKKGTKCYLYFDKLKDTTKPIISNIATSVTKTEITVNVTASDVGVGGASGRVIEYWYQLNNNTPIKSTNKTYKFTGLSASTTYTIKVYVKDLEGNQSDTTTKSVTTSSPIGSDVILANVTVKSGTPNFSQVATTDEGVYSTTDGMYGGTTYYWRGAVTNNYVKFAGFCWRIIRINGDKTIRLIYDGITCHVNGTNTAESIAVISQKYNTSYNQSNYVGWTYSGTSQRTTGGTSSNAKTQTENWYKTNISDKGYDEKVASGKFCNDRETWNRYSWAINGSLFYYASYERIWESYSPTFSCGNSEDIYTLKVGLITVDEAEYAGAAGSTYNTYYYLYNGQNYWTMSPGYWYSSGYSYACVCFLNTSGNLGINSVSWNEPGSVDWPFAGLRPVINLKSDVTFSSGNGTQNSPYVVS